MLLAEGDVMQYGTLEKISTETYLLKLENHINRLESDKKMMEELKRKAK